jgi:CRISPR/Cas system CSM-associated protein Csm3 (group 7 of RAMP superfamily)
MHKATFLEGEIKLTITPNGPILIKAGESGGADPTLPDMEFVRTANDQVFIPGSSLKGVVRAQCERICRSLDSEDQQKLRQQARRERFKEGAADEPRIPLADNPLGRSREYRGLDDMNYSSGDYIESIRDVLQKHPERTAVVYRRSSFVSQMFGHTSLAGRVRFADAYPAGEVRLEERNGVAIDRIYGSVAVGPFNYETAVAGQFVTQINVKNLTLAQLALLGLALRDLADGRIGIGFGKSRGLGRVKVNFTSLELYYPTCQRDGDKLALLNGRTIGPLTHLAGLGALCDQQTYDEYNLPTKDSAPLPAGFAYADDAFLGVRLRAEGDEQVREVWKACMPAWKRELGLL